MVDLRALRQTIRATPAGAPAAAVSRDWLQAVERDLTELQLRRLKDSR